MEEELLRIGGRSKAALAKVLSRVHNHDLLVSDTGSVARSTTTNGIVKDIHDVGCTPTPYGQLLEKLDLGLPDVPFLDYINPFALLYHLSAVSTPFANVMRQCSNSGQIECRVVLYIDACCPGNPLRPDASRTTECVYWCIPELPDYLLKRAGSWMLFTTVRTSIANQLSGNIRS